MSQWRASITNEQLASVSSDGRPGVDESKLTLTCCCVAAAQLERARPRKCFGCASSAAVSRASSACPAQFLANSLGCVRTATGGGSAKCSGVESLSQRAVRTLGQAGQSCANCPALVTAVLSRARRAHHDYRRQREHQNHRSTDPPVV